MSRFDVRVEVSLRPGIADPEGSTIERVLPALGFSGVDGVRMAKAIRFGVEASDEAEARRTAEELCRRLLANPVIEDAQVEVAPGIGASGP